MTDTPKTGAETTEPNEDDSERRNATWLTDARRRRLRLVGRVCLTLLVVAVVLPFVAFAVPQIAGADYSFVVMSGSMEPAISTGDGILVAADDPATVEEGDVITYQRSEEETPTTHRVIDVEGTGDDRRFRTQGDASGVPDGAPVDNDQYVGRVVLTIPFVGYVISFVDTPTGFALLVVLPIVAFVLSEAWGLRSSGRRDDGEGTSTDGGTDGGGERSPGIDGIARDGADGATRSGADDVTRGGTGGATHGAIDPHGYGPDPGVAPRVRPGPRGGAPKRGVPPVDVAEFEATSAPTGGGGDEDDGSSRHLLTGADLAISSILLFAMTCYSGWMVYESFRTFGAPDVVSVTVFTASASSTVLALAVRSQFPSSPDGRSGDDDLEEGAERPRIPPRTVRADSLPESRERADPPGFLSADAGAHDGVETIGERWSLDRSDRRTNGANGGSRTDDDGWSR